MTQNERMVWAVAYVADYFRQDDAKTRYGAPQSVPTSVEYAWAVVSDMRKARAGVADGFGTDSEVFAMLQEMCGERS